jgi:ubiquilin
MYAGGQNKGMGGGMGGMGGMGAGGFPAAPAAPAVAPEVQYASQLEQIAGMGFTDRERVLEILARVNGNVNQALDILLGGS